MEQKQKFINSLKKKKTSELLDLFPSFVDEKGNLLDGYEEVEEEIYSREPFYQLRHPRDEETVAEEFDLIDESLKNFKRHKHLGDRVVIDL